MEININLCNAKLIFQFDLGEVHELTEQHYINTGSHRDDNYAFFWGTILFALDAKPPILLYGSQEVGNILEFLGQFRDIVQSARTGKCEVGHLLSPGELGKYLLLYYEGLERKNTKIISDDDYNLLIYSEIESSFRTSMSYYTIITKGYLEIFTLKEDNNNLVWFCHIKPDDLLLMIDKAKTELLSSYKDYEYVLKKN